MSDQAHNYIPSLIGGVPNKTDFVPSIIFAVAYALSLIPFIIRWRNRNTRTYTFALNTLAFSVERVVVYSIRATQSHDHALGEKLSKGRLVYQQVSFALGFIGFGSDCVAFMRAAMVNTTFADPVRGSEDDARKRFWYRRAADFSGLVWMISSVPGAVGYSSMPGSADHVEAANKLFTLRYVSASTALFLLLFYTILLLRIRNRTQWLDRRAVDWTCLILAISSIIPIYRLTLLHNRTSILNVLPSTPPLYPPGSLTNTASKATFYIFHSLPELVVAWTIQSMNIRGVYNTGAFGDWQGTDDRGGIPRLRVNGVLTEGVGVRRGDDVNWGPVGRFFKRLEANRAPDAQDGKGSRPVESARTGSQVELTQA